MIHVLIVEDDPMVAQINKRYVNSVEGFKVIGCSDNGEDALDFCQKHAVQLIILDIYMPKLNGIEFLKILRREFIMIDVILVTASKESDMIDVALKLGAVDYLIKPFQYDRFKKALDNYLQRIALFKSRENVKQEELDKVTGSSMYIEQMPIAKGLHKNTLNRIYQYFNNKGEVVYTSEELSEQLDLSKVTIRRYMEYLESIGRIHVEIHYGTIGRPSYLYKYIRN